MHSSDHDLAQVVWDYMRYEQAVEVADVIIGLGCHDIGVAEYAASLYLDGYAPHLLFCGAVGRMTRGTVQNEADWFAARAIEMGVPEDAILRERRSTNTGENARNAKQMLEEVGISTGKIIVVHKPYMLRRDYATFMKQWDGARDGQFIFSAQPGTMDEYCAHDETLTAMVNIMLGDLQRIREYPKSGFQIEQTIPDDVWAAYEELVRRGYTEHLLV